MKSWIIREEIPEIANENLKAYPELIRALLYQRGIETKDDARIFLNPDYARDVHDPFKLLNMERSAERIIEAIEKGERIVVYADYDADGIPGSVVMHDFLVAIGYENFEIYIPHRYDEGYGLNIPAVEQFAIQGVNLIITIDCGITDILEVARASELGIDVIVTDHHLPQKKLPEAYAIINPNQDGDTYPFPHLCGGGLAFKLVQGLLKKGEFENLTEGWEKWLLDAAGISTMSDMVPLRGENRVIASFGLHVLKKNKRVGIQKLLQKKGIRNGDLTEDDVGFIITPHINAASRMATPRDAFKMLSTKDFDEASQIVRFLSGKNEERKKLVERILEEIDEELQKNNDESLISLGNRSWPPGVLGLAAHRVMEKHGKPVCLWGGGESTALRGSCRSDGSVNIVDLMSELPDGYMRDFGGHEFSGGFSLTEEGVTEFSKRLLSAYTRLKKNIEEEPVYIDKELNVEDITWQTFNLIQTLAPFGRENPKPVFLFKNILIKRVEYFGKEKNHLKLILQKESGEEIEAIKFFWGPDEFGGFVPIENMKVDLVANLEKSIFFRKVSLRLRILIIKEVSA